MKFPLYKHCHYNRQQNKKYREQLGTTNSISQERIKGVEFPELSIVITFAALLPVVGDFKADAIGVGEVCRCIDTAAEVLQ